MEAGTAWRPTRRLSHPALCGLWLACLLATPPALALQQATTVTVSTPLASLTADPRFVVVRLSSLVVFVWLLLVWVWSARLSRRVLRVAGTAAVWVVVATGTLLVLEVPALETTRTVLATLVQAVVTLAYYRWRVGDDNLTPHRPGDVAALFVACLLGAVASAPVAPLGNPVITTGRVDLALAAWVVVGAAYAFIGAACLLLLVQRRPRAEALPTRLTDVYGLLLVTGLAVGLQLYFPGLPLSWAVLLPAIWAGLLMGPWTTAALGLTTSTAVVAATLALEPDAADAVAMVELLLLYSLMVAFVLVALLLSLARDQRAHLAQEVVTRRQEAVDQAGLLETLLESLDQALLLLDTEGRVQLHNRAARALFGDRLESEPTTWLRHRGTTSARFSYAVRRNDDHPRIVSVQLAAVQYAGAGGVMAVARDITSEHDRLEELASFAAVAAHDLKSPLAAVEGWLEVADDVIDHDGKRARHALGRGRAAARRMASEIDDWLAYTVAREGELTPEPVALTPMLHEIASAHPGGDFSFATQDVVRGDRTLLRHLLANLVGNAVKYTLPGEQPRVRVVSSRRDNGWVQVQVLDEGIGIPVGEETAVFEPFRRATTVTGSYEGSGLGLALCKRIVRRHGGAISAARNEGGPGTTITVTLPPDRSPLRA